MYILSVSLIVVQFFVNIIKGYWRLLCAFVADWMNSAWKGRSQMWLALFSKIFSERIGKISYIGILGQSFVQMADGAHSHQGESGHKFINLRNCSNALLQLTHFSLTVLTVARVSNEKLYITLLLFFLLLNFMQQIESFIQYSRDFRFLRRNFLKPVVVTL